MITRIDHDDLFIAGSFVRASATSSSAQIDSATEEIVGTVPVANAADVDRAVSAARTAFANWSRTSPAERSEVLGRVADRSASALPRSRTSSRARTARPAGGSIHIAEAVYRNAAKKAAQVVEEEFLPGGEHGTIVRQEPLGVVAAIAPWNGPEALLGMKLAAVIAAGCTVVADPAPETSLDAFLLRRGLPGGGPAGRRLQSRHRRGRRRSGPDRAPGHRQGLVHRVNQRPAGPSAPPARARSRNSSLSWAASPGRSCSATPTSIPSPTRSPGAAFSSPDRCATRSPGSSRPGRGTPRCWSA